MWKKGATEADIKRALDEAGAEDSRFSDGRIFGSMCAEPLSVAKEAHLRFIEANLGNPGLYPGTNRLEREVIGALVELLNGGTATGTIVSGGTEANITALWIARNITGKRKVIFPRSAHFSFHKACDMLALEPIVAPLNEAFTIDVDAVERALDDDVCAVVGIAGTTELGMVDDIPGLANFLPGDTFLHVDAAFGGFVIPFLKRLSLPAPDFDFSIPQVSTLTVDPHKMGMSTIPSGCLLLREEEWTGKIRKEAPYLSTVGQTAALSGTRCSAAVAATYAAMRSLGEEGYTKLVDRCMRMTSYAISKAERLGIGPVVKPVMNIVGFYVPDPRRIQRKLDKLGWNVSVARNPECLRLVIMPYATEEFVDGLFEDLENVLEGRM